MPPKRIRTVEGSCWSCKQRRVKCSLEKPACSKCIVAGTKCSYDKILIKWDARPRKGSPVGNQLCLYHHSLPGSSGYNLAINERRAIDYFRSRVWPLFSTSAHPCPPPIALAMADRSVLLATCVMADSHRVLFDGRNSKENVYNKRLHCITTVRKQLADAADSKGIPLSTVLVAVLLMYFSDGFVECNHPDSSTLSHHAGARAIINSLGGLSAIMSDGETSIKMLLSEFATTDLTNALLHGTPPSFPSKTWEMMDMNAVWWEKTPPGMESFASIFQKMSDLASYHDLVSLGKQEFSVQRIKEFEADLRPGYASISPVELTDHKEEEEEEDQKPLDPDMVPSSALLRAFQHSANLYLYRAVCGLPANHYVVQQHAQACLDCIMGMPSQSKALNCALFPLLVSGAHAFLDTNKQAIVRKLDVVYGNLKFNAVKSIRSALEDLWASPRQGGSWFEMFTGLDAQALVL